MRVDAVTISLSLILHFNQISCEKNERGVEDIFKEIFIHYDKRIIPFEKGQPVICDVQYLILNLADMKPINNHITVEAILYASWKDHRLLFQTNNATEHYSLTSDSVSTIWAPDLLFWSLKSGEISSVTRKNVLAQIRPDGQVLLSQRHMMTIYCNMKTFLFPFDDQYCNITILSFAYSRVWLRLFWNNSNAVRTRGNFDKGKFTLISYKLKKDVVDFHIFGSFDVLQLTLRLRRKAMPYVLRIYIPLFIIVIMSWVGFWINHHSVPARTLVSSCLVLTMIMFITDIHKSLPRTGELRVVDLHMMVCFLYVFAGLVEYAMVQTIDIRVKIIERKKSMQDEERRKTTENTQLNEGPNSLDPTEIINDPAQEQDENLKRTKRNIFCCNPLEAVMQRLTDLHMVHQNDYHILDKISKVAFPLTFIIYNVVYFTSILLSRKNEQ